MTKNRVSFEYLPDSLRNIAEMCGVETMWRLWESRAGTRFRVPSAVNEEHFLYEVLGAELAQNFCANFKGELLTIPVAKAAQDIARNELIHFKRFILKRSISQIALEFRVTERTVSNILSKGNIETAQVDLFGETNL